MRYYVVFVLLFITGSCEITTESSETLLNLVANYVNSSVELDKNDRKIMKGWSADFQVQQVNVTSHYRLEMVRHKEHCFHWINSTHEWQECLLLHKEDIDKSEMSYYTTEGKCLRAANVYEGKRRHSVYQVEKEIKKWRKSYRYLVNLCKTNNPGDEVAAGECLVEYMKRDNYHVTFQRLILLKLESMSHLFSQMMKSLQSLEECLKSALSQYLTDERNNMNLLNQCYNIKNKKS